MPVKNAIAKNWATWVRGADGYLRSDDPNGTYTPASSATVTWTALADGTQTGYAIYYGTATGAYTTRVDAGLVTSYEVTPLSSGVRYYFIVQAYFANGDETPASDEVNFLVA